MFRLALYSPLLLWGNKTVEQFHRLKSPFSRSFFCMAQKTVEQFT